MARLPRLAIGTVQKGVDAQSILWAMIEAMQRIGVHVQNFRSRACFPRCQGAGVASRHLDSWLMTAQACREAFFRGAQTADLAMVEGQFGCSDESLQGGQLEHLCQWLDLPRLAVVDASQLDPCRIPRCPPNLRGVLLDRIIDDRHLARLSTALEALWAVPVLGALEELPSSRAALAGGAAGTRPPARLRRELGEQFLRHCRLDRLLETSVEHDWTFCGAPICRCSEAMGQITVAIGFDEGLNCYYPDTLDQLERQGATIVDFSPLRDESLPPGADVVYLGCGHPERFAAALAENHCLKAALRSHLSAGRRLYAEGAGAAYLCQQMVTPRGDYRMVGILPAIAKWHPRGEPKPVEMTLAHDTWLGPRGIHIRGYTNPDWQFSLLPGAQPLAALGQTQVIGNPLCVGSLVHLNFAAQPALLGQFFRPASHRTAVDPWAYV